MASHKCLWTINSLYVEKTALGYKASPCCLWDEEITPSVEKIEELQNNPFTDSVRKRFKKDWKRPQCQECVVNEDLGKTSKRQRNRRIIRTSTNKTTLFGFSGRKYKESYRGLGEQNSLQKAQPNIAKAHLVRIGVKNVRIFRMGNQMDYGDSVFSYGSFINCSF